MKLADSKLETYAHIETVRRYIKIFTDKLTQRGIDHDKTKLESPEAEGFAEVNDKLKHLTYGTPEYEENLKSLQTTLQHHYAKNKHHPEHYKNGVNDMTLIDLLEMICDWKASTWRQHDGNLLQSLEKNATRYGISKQLLQILKNTAVMLDEEDVNK
ncbi:MAG: DUF5662 family protein [Bacilli bacterium]|nr:DUF5662 family protein [Bacilli bacterium]